MTSNSSFALLYEVVKFLPSFVRDVKTSASKGFTLVELLVVVAILGVLGAAIVIAIDPVDKIRAANDATAINHVGSIATAAESYAATNNGYYPATLANLVASGDLKNSVRPPSGYGTAYPLTTYTGDSPSWVQGTCTAGTTCTRVTTSIILRSKKYTTLPAPQGPKLIWDSGSGEKCFKPANDTTNACP